MIQRIISRNILVLLIFFYISQHQGFDYQTHIGCEQTDYEPVSTLL